MRNPRASTDAYQTIKKEHRVTACELFDLLQTATNDGTLDELAAFIHPDIINKFCDAVADMTTGVRIADKDDEQ